MSELLVQVCEACGEALFPLRTLCPRCGGSRRRLEPAERGVVEQATEHRGAAIASVRTDVGPVVIVRSRAAPGSRVRLSVDGSGAPIAEPDGV